MVRPRQFTDRELLETARLLFLEHGPGLSTTVIAKAAGVSQATLFKRFGTKKALMIRALIPDQDGRQWQALMRMPDERPLFDQLVEKGLILMAFFQELLPCVAMLRASGADIMEELHNAGQVPPPVRALNGMQAFFDRAIAEGRMRPVSSEMLALTWLGALRNRAFFQHMMPERPLEGDNGLYVHALTETIWRGICPVEESS
jgi:AcrR family transcriptional regulator